MANTKTKVVKQEHRALQSNRSDEPEFNDKRNQSTEVPNG